MRLLALLVITVTLATAGCSSGSGSTCQVIAPDAGTIACDFAWSCDDTVFELACASESGALKCACITDGTATTFMVSEFDCNAETALKTATSGCGWSIAVDP